MEQAGEGESRQGKEVERMSQNRDRCRDNFVFYSVSLKFETKRKQKALEMLESLWGSVGDKRWLQKGTRGGRRVEIWKKKRVRGKGQVEGKTSCLSTFGASCCSTRSPPCTPAGCGGQTGQRRGDLLHPCGSFINNTHTFNQQHRKRFINRSQLSSKISERLDLESPYMLSHCIASSH